MVCALCTASIAGNLLSAVVAAAQDPKVVMTLSVQNQTTNSTISDANTVDSALAVKNGDILKYVATITNDADAAENGDNDFMSTKVISDLPAGLELVHKPSDREINIDIGTIAPKKTITETFTVRVTANNGESIESKACFTGRYEVKNKTQSNCESAFIAVADATPAPIKEEKPAATPATPVQSTEKAQEPSNTTGKGDLPTTGPSDIIAPLAALSAGSIAYAGRLISLKQRRN